MIPKYLRVKKCETNPKNATENDQCKLKNTELPQEN